MVPETKWTAQFAKSPGEIASYRTERARHRQRITPSLTKLVPDPRALSTTFLVPLARRVKRCHQSSHGSDNKQWRVHLDSGRPLSMTSAPTVSPSRWNHHPVSALRSRAQQLVSAQKARV